MIRNEGQPSLLPSNKAKSYKRQFLCNPSDVVFKRKGDVHDKLRGMTSSNANKTTMNDEV